MSRLFGTFGHVEYLALFINEKSYKQKNKKVIVYKYYLQIFKFYVVLRGDQVNEVDTDRACTWAEIRNAHKCCFENHIERVA